MKNWYLERSFGYLERSFGYLDVQRLDDVSKDTSEDRLRYRFGRLLRDTHVVRKPGNLSAYRIKRCNGPHTLRVYMYTRIRAYGAS